MKCPHCGQHITNVNLVGPTIGNSVFGPLVTGYTAVCPHAACQAVLGVTPNPDAIVKQVVKALGGGKR